MAPDRIAPALHLRGMGGLGDGIHQRAVVRHWMQTHNIWLDTPWPSLYHDLVGPGLRLLPIRSSLRTQAKNERRQAAFYRAICAPTGAKQIQVSYTPTDVRKGTVLSAMLKATGCPRTAMDFRLPVPDEWHKRVSVMIERWRVKKPIMVLRPLVLRTEWGGCRARNPDLTAYRDLFDLIRKDYFVVSVADIVPSAEWLADSAMGADVELHQGELPFEQLAALFQRAALVFASPGFAVPLAQAVGTAVVCVFGNYECSKSFADGAAWAPYLGIDPIDKCQCFQHSACAHSKKIDMQKAIARLRDFSNAATCNKPR